MNRCFLLFSIYSNQLITSLLLCHCLNFVFCRTILLIFAVICLLIFPILLAITGSQEKNGPPIPRLDFITCLWSLGHSYINYEVACTLLSMEPLYIRRIQLCLNFGKKDLKKNDSLFKRSSKNIHTRSAPKLVDEYKCRTKRYENSSLPYLARLLNK